MQDMPLKQKSCDTGPNTGWIQKASSYLEIENTSPAQYLEIVLLIAEFHPCSVTSSWRGFICGSTDNFSHTHLKPHEELRPQLFLSQEL